MEQAVERPRAGDPLRRRHQGRRPRGRAGDAARRTAGRGADLGRHRARSTSRSTRSASRWRTTRTTRSTTSSTRCGRGSRRRSIAKGFVVLNWADAGWLRFFTTSPVATPDDLQEADAVPVGGRREVARDLEDGRLQGAPRRGDRPADGPVHRPVPGVRAVAAGGADRALLRAGEVHDRPAAGRCCSARRSSRRTRGRRCRPTSSRRCSRRCRKPGRSCRPTSGRAARRTSPP